MKTRLLTLCLLCLSLATTAQQGLSLSVVTGIGGNIETCHMVSSLGSSDRLRTYGYQVPAEVHLQYEAPKWRLGLSLGYRYAEEDLVYTRWQSGIYSGHYRSVTGIFTHVLRPGITAGYTFWQGGRHTVSVCAGAGIQIPLHVRPENTTHPIQPYGTVGIEAAYTLGHDLQLLYAAGLSVQGGKAYQVPMIDYASELFTLHQVYFYPTITIGIKKKFALQGKKK